MYVCTISLSKDIVSAQRELDAIMKLCNAPWDEKCVQELRKIFMSDRRDGPQPEARNLILENPEAYRNFLERYALKACKDNPKQQKCLRILEAMPDWFHSMHGPPDTGKTHMLALLIITAVLTGHKVKLVAPTNVAASKYCTRIMIIAMEIIDDPKLRAALLRKQAEIPSTRCLGGRFQSHDADRAPDGRSWRFENRVFG